MIQTTKTRIVVLAHLFIIAGLIHAQRASDTVRMRDHTTQFHPKQLIVPASLVAVGSWGTCNNGFQKVNHSIRNTMKAWRNNQYFHADDYIQYLPVASNLALGVLGVPAKHTFKERLAVTATAYIAMGMFVGCIKIAADVRRPDGSALNSFPSGHTATAFVGAELVRTEYGLGYGIAAYSLACGVAFLRLYNERHWLSDVIAGAGFGIVSVRIGYWLLPFNQKLFGWDKKESPLVLTRPFYDPRQKAIGAALAVYL